MSKNEVFQYIFYPKKEKKKNYLPKDPTRSSPKVFGLGVKKAKNPTRPYLIGLDIFSPKPDPCTPLKSNAFASCAAFRVQHGLPFYFCGSLAWSSYKT